MCDKVVGENTVCYLNKIYRPEDILDILNAVEKDGNVLNSPPPSDSPEPVLSKQFTGTRRCFAELMAAATVTALVGVFIGYFLENSLVYVLERGQRN